MEANLGDWILDRIRDTTPERTALVRAGESIDTVQDRLCSFGELSTRARRLAAGLRAQGLRSGDRVVVLLPVDEDLYALALALLSCGMVTVLIDPAVGLLRLDRALRQTRPSAVISTTAFFRLRWIWPTLWQIPHKICRGGSGLGLRSYDVLLDPATEDLDQPTEASGPSSPDDTALLTFTSGSTGQAKAVERAHRTLLSQHHALRQHLPYQTKAVVLTEFPVVVLHNLACGVETVLAHSDPKVRLEQIRRRGVTTLCAAPAFLEELAEEVEADGGGGESVREIFVGGAPVSPGLCRQLLEAFPNAQGRIVYGSTEVEPIASISFDEAMDAEGEGYVVGQAVPGIEVTLGDPKFSNENSLSDGAQKVRGDLGEVWVRGARVARSYAGRTQDPQRSPIRDAEGLSWFRTGDLARFDDLGRLWLLGRVGDEVCREGRVLSPLPIEKKVDAFEGVRACAFIHHRRAPQGELAVELSKGATKADFERIRHKARRVLDLGDLWVRRVDSIPRERRHRSKIDRVALRQLLGGGPA